MLQDNDDSVTTLNLNDGDGAADTTTTTTTTVEDRGDELTPAVNPQALAAVVAEDDAGGATDGAGEGGKPNSPFVPMARFSQVNEQKNELATKLAEAQAELERYRTGGQAPAAAPAPAPAAPAVELTALHREHAEALMEGDTDRAVEIAVQIAAENRRIAREEIRQEEALAKVANTLQEASAQAIADFPYLDTPEGADALELIVLDRDKAIASGVPPHVALANAVAKIAPRFAPADGGTPQTRLQNSNGGVDNRTANAIQRGARDSTMQAPMAPVGVGNRTTENRPDVANMTEAQFESLSDAEKRRMRGDM